MTRWILLLALAVAAPAWSTSIEPMPLEALLAKTDHVVLATVTAVDMVDAEGEPVTDPQARTGPGSRNLIRYHLQVDRVVTSTSAKVPATLVVPEWQMWHYSLGQMQRSMAHTQYVFLLRAHLPAGRQRPVPLSRGHAGGAGPVEREPLAALGGRGACA